MKLITKEFNTITGEITITEREETDAESKARLDREKEKAAAQAQRETNAIQKAALLEKLGITADEAALLLS
jgi:hypothetical protein